MKGERKWSTRNSFYKVGFFLLVVGTLAFALGHVAPFWIRQQAYALVIPPIDQVDFGIWYKCTNNICSYLSTNEGYLKVTRVLEVIGLAGLLLSILIAIIFNCRRRGRNPNIILEVTIIISALIGFSGSLVYLGYTRSTVAALTNVHYDWAFAVNVAGGGLAFIAGVVIFLATRCCNGSDKSSRQTDFMNSPYDYNPEYREEDYEMFYKDGGPHYGHPPLPSPPTVPYTVPIRGSTGPLPHQHHFNINGYSGQPHPMSSRDDEPYRYPQLPPSPSHRRNIVIKTTEGPEGTHERELGHISRSWQDGLNTGDPAGPIHQSPRVYPGADHTGAFALPRVVVRGYYEPGYGYPEYIMI